MLDPSESPDAPKVLRFSTARIPVGHRVEHWESHNAKALIGLDIRTIENTPLVAEEVNLHFPAMRFARVKGSSQVVERSEQFIAEHPTGDVAMFFALGGEAFFYHPTGMILLKPGQAVLYDADRPFLRGFAAGLRELVLTIPREEYIRLSHGASLKEPVIFEFSSPTGLDPAAAGLASLINSALDRRELDPQQVEQEAFGLVEQLLARARGTSSAYRLARDVIERRFNSPGLSRADVASAVGVSERQLTRLFAANDESFAERLLAHRLQAAEALLVSNTEAATPISEIAARCGFSSQAHFSRAFKAHTGVTPSELRRAGTA